MLENGSIKAAITIYQSILHDEKDESIDGRFYGKIYGCLGAAYGRLFLYQEAAKMYEAAYQICEDETMLKAYLYACKMHMSRVEYGEMLNRSSLYKKIDEWLINEKERLEDEIQVLSQEDSLKKWKEQYRKNHAGDI